MSGWSADTPRPSRGLWFAILGAPIVWGVQGLLSWLIAEETCLGSAQQAGAHSQAAIRTLEVAIFLAALAVGLAALTLAIRSWRSLPDHSLHAGRTMDRRVFMHAVAMLIAASFTAGIIWMGVVTLWLPVCERVR